MPQDKRTSPPLTTFANPEGLAVLTAAGVTAAVAAMPVIVVPGVLAYGILTWLRFSRWKDQVRSAEFEPIAVDTSKLIAPYSNRVATCIDLQARVLREIAASGPLHRRLLTPSVDRVRSLARAAYDLADNLQQLNEHLLREDPAVLEREASALQGRVATAVDPLARDRFQRALDQHRQKEELYGELHARWERMDAQLTTIQLTLETVAAQVLRIKSAEAGTASNESVRVLESLEALTLDVQTLAETVEETTEARGSLEAHRLRTSK